MATLVICISDEDAERIKQLDDTDRYLKARAYVHLDFDCLEDPNTRLSFGVSGTVAYTD